MKTLVLILAALLTGCRSASVTSFETGEELKCKFNPYTHSISATMPNGEALKGKFSTVANESVGFSFGSASVIGGPAIIGQGTSFGASGPGNVYALLKSTQPGSKLMLEIVARYGVLSGHGFGEARTNDGRKYKVQF